MRQIKTFLRLCVDDVNDKEINKFLSSHNVKDIKTNVMQGFTYTSDRNYVSQTDTTLKPSIITTIVYEVEK